MSTTPVVPETKGQKFLEVLEKVFTIIPYIAAGVSLVESNKSVEDKTTIATQVANVATQGVIAELPTEDQETGAAIGNAANQTLATIIQLLHPSTTTVPPVTP